MNKILRRANKRIGLGGAAALLIGTAMIGQLLGLLRTKLVNANFSALGPQSTDAYFAAFKIPDFFFFTLAAGALGVAFMPFVADHLERSDRKGLAELTSSLLNLLAIVMFFVGLIIIIFAEPLLHYVVSPNLTPEQLHNAATIMRLIALNPLIFTISGILTTVQQAFGRFFFFAIAPLIYNASIIAGIFLFKDSLGLIGLGVGALVGAILQLGIVLLGMVGTGFRHRQVIRWPDKDFRQILRQLPARSVDQGIDSINSIVETNFARRLGEGNLSYYENAYTLHNAPTLLIGTAIATAAFPRLTERLSQGRKDLFRKDFLQILRAMIWLSLPVIVVCYFARGYFARLLFAKNAPEIATIFGFLAGAIFFRILYAIISRWFYAQKDTKTPLLVSLFAIALNIYLAYRLSRPDVYGVAGLAIAQSLVAATEVCILFVIMLTRDPKLFDLNFIRGVVKTISVTGFSMIAAFIMLRIFPLTTADRGFVTLGAKLSSIGLVTISVHVAISALFGLEESQPIVRKIKQFVLKPVRIQ